MIKEKKLTLKEKIQTILKDCSGQMLTANEIASKIYDKFTKDCEEKFEKSNNKDKFKKNKEKFIKDQLRSEIASPTNKIHYSKYNIIWLPNETPEKFYYEEEINNNKEDNNKEDNNKEDNNKEDNNKEENEEDTYAPIIKCLYDEKIYSIRINEKLTNKGEKGKFKWVHPDIIGIQCENGILWEKETTAIAKFFGINKIKIYSYEVKIDLNLSKLRECYFQAVSNSTWANYGYLVFYQRIENKQLSNDILTELKRLNNSFGIGVLQLKQQEENNYILETIIEAKEKENIDFDTLDLLIKTENNDITEFCNILNQATTNNNDKINTIKLKIKEHFKNTFKKEIKENIFNED